MQIREKPKRRVIINITSLIDVLFLLLIFFMVSSTFLEQPGMKLDLPETSQKAAVKRDAVTVYVTRDENIFFDDEKIEFEQLAERLRDAAGDVGDDGILLQADENVRYGLVVKVMDAIKQSGIHKMVVATKIREEASE